MHKGTLRVTTTRKMEMIDITSEIQQAITEAGRQDGICHVYNPHTTAGLTINEGADPDVQTDIIEALKKIVPQDHPYRHAEGNSPAHVMATLTGNSLTVFVTSGRLELGTWQRIFFCEFDGPRSRKVHWQLA